MKAAPASAIWRLAAEPLAECYAVCESLPGSLHAAGREGLPLPNLAFGQDIITIT